MTRPFQVPDAATKQAVWDAYQRRQPTRVPLRWNVNCRIILQNPALNPDGYTFEQYLYEPRVTLAVQARFQEYVATELSRVCDYAASLPERWSFRVDSQNTCDGAYFGSPIECAPGNCPSNLPCMTEADVDDFLARDFSRPLENPWIRSRLAYREELVRAARDFTYAGRGGDVAPFTLGFDGPVTIGAVLLGADMFTLLGADPDKAERFLRTMTEAVFVRNKALVEHSGTRWEPGDWAWAADDSIQLISTAMYEERVLPIHERWYALNSKSPASAGHRSIHLCGDATRHFPLIHKRLGVTSFDTGFPVDHGWLRRTLGPDVEISGGPHVSILQNGTPEQCAEAARAILQSGIMEGGRFILQEGNNLPPGCPMENLEAVYATCLEHGRYTRS